MDSRIFVAVCSALLLVNGQPIAEPENNNQNFVPGVFISADALKDLQEKAQQNQIAQPITNEEKPITNAVNPLNHNENREQLKVGTTTVISSVPIVSQPTPSQPILSNQPIASSPILSSQQLLPQRQPQIVVTNPQPNQGYLVTQQPSQAILVQQPSYQQPGNQVFLSQLPSNQMLVNQGGNQMPANTQVLLQNGQIAQILPQPYTNQPMLQNNIGNQNSRSNMPSGTTLYAMVPVNGPSNLGVPNTNIGNGNSYLMPVQQQPGNQVYAITG